MRAALRPADEGFDGAILADDIQGRFAHDRSSLRAYAITPARVAWHHLSRPRRASCSRQFTPTARLMVEPISALMTRSANSSCSVGSRLMITRRAPLRLASTGNPAAG